MNQNTLNIRLSSVLFSLLLLLISSCSTPSLDLKSPTKGFDQRKSLSGWPDGDLSKSKSDYLIDHGFFQILYNPEFRLAKYVSYELKGNDLKKKSFKRKDRFLIDPILKKAKLPFVKPSEYSGTGFDRGHLAPSADFSWDEKANDLTFVMSNMVPQKRTLNRGSWKKLETQIRSWACGEEHISVITGPILKENLPRLKSGLIVPEEFFKIIIDETPPKKFIAFIYHQDDKGDVLKQRIVPLSKIENATQISFKNFFKNFDPNQQRALASVEVWKEAKCN